MNKKNISLGFILILLGIVLTLNELNIVDFSFRYIIDGLIELWPIVLIILGISIIFKNDVLNNVLWIIFLIGVILYGSNLQRTYDYNVDVEEESISIELEDNIEKGKLELDIGATIFDIGEENYDYTVINHNGYFDYKTVEKNNIQNLTIKNKKRFNIKDRSNNLFLGLNNKIPWIIDIDSGASKGNLDLENIIVEELDLDIGAENINIRLGNKSPSTKIDIDAGASSIDLNIPSNSGIKIKIEGALNSTNLNDLNLIEEGKYLISKDFENNRNKFYIDVDMGVGKFNINYY